MLTCALRLSSRNKQQNNNKNEPLISYGSMPLLSYIIYYPLNYVLQCLLFCYVWRLCMAINISVQHNGGLLPDIILLTQGYYHRGTRLNSMKRFYICSL